MLKIITIMVLTATAAVTALAQDKIYKRDGAIIEAKVRSVGSTAVTYNRWDNQSGPEYSLPKLDVSKIKYQNGSEDSFDDDIFPPGLPRPHRRTETSDSSRRHTYGRTVAAVGPMQFTENGLGFCFSYERVLDEAGIVAFYVPAIATWHFNNNSYYNSVTGKYESAHQDFMFYFMPGIKLYPATCFRRSSYSIGPNLVYATGDKSEEISVGGYRTMNHMMVGMILNQSLNINPGPHVYMGFDFGLGFSYVNRIDGANQNTTGLVQGAFRIGYRF